MITCRICQKEYSQITTSHCKSHGITLPEYQIQFPGVQIVSDETADKIRKKLKGKTRTEEHCKNLSTSIRQGFKNGRKPNCHNRGKKYTEAEKAAMKAKRPKKKPLTEEHKKNIGLGNKGKIISEEQKTNQSILMTANPPKPMLGKRHKLESIQKMRDAASILENDEERQLYKIYKACVEYFTRPFRDENRLLGYEFGSQNGKYQVDHIIPKVQGFKNNIPPYIIGSRLNCRVILAEENKQKNATFQPDEDLEKLIDLVLDEKS